MSTRKVYLASKSSYTIGVIPLLWCSLKTYYEENSKNHQQWEWADPWVTNEKTKEQILDQCQLEPPSVFGFSVYVWNEEFFDDLARAIKQQHPDCLIVYGGPQPNVKYNKNFFKEKFWVDVVVPGDAYGEIVFKELLDNYPSTDYSTVPYIYYTDLEKNWHFSDIGINKKEFNWPSNVFKAQEKFLLPRIKEMDLAIVETSRGCPYKCIYCDWGGGTYTKISKKPFTTVLDEIEWLAQNQIKAFTIADANFGIMAIDVDIAEHIVEMSKKYGYPKQVHHENAKNHVKRVVEIEKILISQGLLESYKLSIQSVDEEIKNNVERIDPPFEEQVRAIRDLKDNFANLPIKVEIIIGLPGDNYQKTLDQIDLLINNEVPIGRSHPWLLLPESPAFSPDMREQFQIKTIQKMGWTGTWAVKDNFKLHPDIIHNFNAGGWANTNVESVIGTYSYSSLEWIDIYLVNSLSLANESTGVNTYLAKYLSKEHSRQPSELLDFIYKAYVKPNELTSSSKLKQLLSKSYTNIHDWVFGDSVQMGVDYHPDFPLLLTSHTYFSLVSLTNADEFYTSICQQLAEKFQDPKLIDLGVFLRNSMLDSEYNPTTGRVFETEYNWLDYFTHGELNKKTCTYQLDDQQIYLDRRMQDINWHLYSDTIKRHEQYLYQAASYSAQVNMSKTLRLI